VPVDLHLHSTFSDGTDSPAAIVEAARRIGLSAIALTDHDNLDGISEGRTAAEAAGVRFVAGTELSVVWDTGAMHMLVYFLEPGPGPLQDRLVWLQQARASRNEQIADRLAQLGLDVRFAEVVEEAGGHGIGRPHFAAVLVRKGYAVDMADAFDRYLAAGRPGYISRERLDAHEAISLARASGAAPVIAHPHTLGVAAEDYRSAFVELAEAGLAGIEAYYPEYPSQLRAHLAEVCAHLGIAATGGSDYHGTYKPGLAVGTGYGDLVVPDDALNDLAAAVAR
jgi:hypothetical protein